MIHFISSSRLSNKLFKTLPDLILKIKRNTIEQETAKLTLGYRHYKKIT